MGTTKHTGRFLLLSSLLGLGGCDLPRTQQPEVGHIQVAQVPYAWGTVTVFVLRSTPPPPPEAPVVMAFPWGEGTGGLTLDYMMTYWDVEAPARGYIVVGVQAPGPDVAGAADVMIPAIFSWMDANVSYDRDRVVAAGASGGGRGLFHAVLAAPDAFAAMIGMPGEYAGDAADLLPLADKPVWLLVGEQDTEWRALVDTTQAKLESQGVPVTVDVLPEQYHVVHISQTHLMDWIDAALGR